MARSLSFAVLLSALLVVLRVSPTSGSGVSPSSFETVFVGDGASPDLEDPDPHELVLGQTARGELAGGGVESYTIRLDRDQFVFARVMQLGVDLVVTVHHPGGRVLAETDGLQDGPEFVSLTSDTSGVYQIDLRPFYPLASRGSYFVQVLEHRVAAQTLPGKVDQLFAELDQAWMPGAIVVVLANGEIAHTNAFGMADLQDNVPLTTATPINICSIGKQLTAFAIALLADRGQLGLDDGIRDHLPWVPDFGHQITIRHLIHHTSGLREIYDLWALTDRVGVPVSRADVLWYVQRQQELNFLPGEQYLYCNTGYILLGEIVEEVTGLPFIDWIQANVLDPLGMRDTHFYHDVGALPGGFAWSYRVGSDGGFERYDMLPAWYVAAGNVFTTAEDLQRWLLHLEDPWICSPRIIERMAQAGTLTGGGSTSYAFGQDRQTYRGLPVLEHGGGGWGYQAFIMRCPEQRFATIVVSNFVYGKAFSRAHQITDLYLPAHLSDEKPDDEYVNRRRAIAIEPDLLDAYTGTYEQSSGAIATFARDGTRLHGQIAGANRLALFPETASSFFTKETDLQVRFDTNDRDEVAQLTVLTPVDTVTYTRASGASVDHGTDLTDYVGRYVSEELVVQHEVFLEDGQMWVRLPGGTRAPCTHVHDDLFRCPFNTITFDRDERSRVVGYRVSTERSRNIRFRKQL